MTLPSIATDLSTAAENSSGWLASLHLGFRRIGARTVLAERRRQGPLAVQRALYPEGDCCHTYLLHPPGGVAGGDQLEISAEVSERASALVTTPGATKFYRTSGPRALQAQNLRVNGGCLEWLPQENIFFPGARVELSTTVELCNQARFIGWEIHCLGRPVNRESFEPGQALFRFSLQSDGRPLLHERLQLDSGDDLWAGAGLRGHPVTGSLYATVGDAGMLERLREQIPEAERTRLGITWIDGLLVARYLGDSTETARRLFTALWTQLRPAVADRPASPPRIWNT